MTAPDAADPAGADAPPEPPAYGETWVYESLVGALPGLALSARAAVGIQLAAFGGGVLVFGFGYGLDRAVLPGLVAVSVAGAGSLAMLRLAGGIRSLDPPAAYRDLLFGSGVEVVLAVLAFVGLLTYLFVADPRAGGAVLLPSLLGPDPPVVVTYLTLLVLWDLCYRIGTSWWAAVTALWRARRYAFEPDVARSYRRLDALNVAFALVQVALLPFVWSEPPLALAVGGHIAAVALTEAAAMALQRG